MKYFNLLKFDRRSKIDSYQAIIFFDNKYGASIITGSNAYVNNTNPYELAIIYGNKTHYDLIYDTYITGDIIGYCNKEKINELLKSISKLPIRSKND